MSSIFFNDPLVILTQMYSMLVTFTFTTSTWNKGSFSLLLSSFHPRLHIPSPILHATMLSNTLVRTTTRRIISSAASSRRSASSSAVQAFNKQGEEARRAAFPLLAVAALGGCAVTLGRQNEVCQGTAYLSVQSYLCYYLLSFDLLLRMYRNLTLSLFIYCCARVHTP
jgi:hypothetical protein